MKDTTVLVAALALAAAACGGGGGDASHLASVSTSEPPPTVTAETTVQSMTGSEALLIGAVVPAAQDLLYTTTDPEWALHSVTVSYEHVEIPDLLLVADGDELERPPASVTVGGQGVLDIAGGNTATMGAVIEPVRVGDVDALGWSVVQNDIPISGVQWPVPGDYQAAMIAIGLDLGAAAELAAGVGFDGTTPTFEPDGGFHAIEASDPNERTVSALFAHGDGGIEVRCSNSGEAGMFAYQLSAFARVAPRKVGAGIIGQRADSTGGPSETALDGAAWLSGGWWCQMWSMPLSSDGTGTVPVIADDQAAALLASLTIVDEPTLRAGAGDATLVLDAERPAAPPALAVPIDPFSGGDAAATGSWHAVFAPGGSRILAIGTRMSKSTTVVQFIDASTGEPLRSFPMSVDGCASADQTSISDDGTMLWDGQVIRDTTTGQVISTPETGFARSVGADFSSDGSLLAVAGGRDTRVIIVSTLTGEVQHALTSGDYVAMCPRFLPGDLQIHLPGLMPADRIWDLATEKITATITVNDGMTLLSADAKYLAIMDEQPRVVEIATGHVVEGITGFVDEFSRGGALALVIPTTSGADGSTGSDPSHSEIWDLHTARRRCVVSTEGGSPSFGTAFSPDGSRLVSTRAGVADVYDTSTCKVVGTLEPDDSGILSVDYSPDGTQILTANSNGHVQIWSAP